MPYVHGASAAKAFRVVADYNGDVPTLIFMDFNLHN